MKKLKEKKLSKKIIEAVTADNLEQLDVLFAQSKNNVKYSSALQWASENGHIKCVKLLIPVSDPKMNNSEALRRASKNGHVKCVKLLIPVSDPNANNSYALQLASAAGHTECVKLLIPVSNPKDDYSSALLISSIGNHQDCVELLLPHSDISTWGEEEWKDIDFDMQNVIKSYFSKISLEQSLLNNNNQFTKTKKSHKI